MGEQTTIVKLQQERYAFLSGVVQAQLGIIIAALASIIDSCNAPPVVDAATGAAVPTSSMTYLVPIGTIVMALFAIYSRWQSQGPLTLKKGDPGVATEVEVETSKLKKHHKKEAP